MNQRIAQPFEVRRNLPQERRLLRPRQSPVHWKRRRCQRHCPLQIRFRGSLKRRFQPLAGGCIHSVKRLFRAATAALSDNRLAIEFHTIVVSAFIALACGQEV